MFSISRKPVALLAAGAVVGSFGMAQAGSAHAATPMVRINPSSLAALQSQLPAKQFSSLSRLFKVNPAVLAGLNPQPLPPLRINAGMLSKIARINPGILAGLNPQPLPPGPDASSVVQPKGGEVSLNPQPLPPGPDAASVVQPKGGEVSLNPQPLPPGPDEVQDLVKPNVDLVALNPQPLPPVAASPVRTPGIQPGQLKVDQLQVKNLRIPVLQG